MHYSSFSSIDTSDSQICYSGQNFPSVLMFFSIEKYHLETLNLNNFIIDDYQIN